MQDLRSFAAEWAAHFASCLESMTGMEVTATAASPEQRQNAETALVWCASISGSPGSRIYLEIEEQVWTALGKLILTNAGITDSTLDDARQTCVEVLQQSIAAFGLALGRMSERDVAFENGEAIAPVTAAHPVVTVTVSTGDTLTATLSFSATDAFISAFGGSAGTNLSAAVQPAGVPRGVPPGSKTLDLLLEVELPVAVSFGRTQMRLKDAAKLTTGSIVELNRSISEPVEVIVNNCVIARGEVVVVEGNYGVRIQEIVSREERLRTLF